MTFSSSATHATELRSVKGGTKNSERSSFLICKDKGNNIWFEVGVKQEESKKVKKEKDTRVPFQSFIQEAMGTQITPQTQRPVEAGPKFYQRSLHDSLT